MTIREADETDIPAIVDVLKASLGDELPISQKIWRYKHIDNPFGPSVVLLAVENGEILGVRAFMQWKWQKKGTEYIAYRAVDTATHPAHRGKGIFKKLTLAAVEEAKERGGQFIFNTPNEQSRPGYIKMGWEIVGRIMVSVKVSSKSFWKIFTPKKNLVVDIDASDEEVDQLCESWNSRLSLSSGFYTPKSAQYLKWRYERNPLQEYSVFSGSGLYLAAGIKERKNFRELRITECIYKNEYQIKEQVKEIIKEWTVKYGIQVISYSPAVLGLGGVGTSSSIGPILTLREMKLNSIEKEALSDIHNWSYSLGDLELF